MILAAPLALLFLLFIPLLVLLHFILRKKKTVTVNSTLIWERVLLENKRLFQVRKLLTNINLLLQVLIVIVLSLALARPAILKNSSKIRGNIICVLDDSAGMKAGRNGETRYDMAKARALELAARIDEGYEMMVLGCGPRPNIISPYSADKNLLQAKIRAAKATDQSDNMAETVRFAQSLRKTGDKIIVLTDGAFDQLEGPELLKNLFIEIFAEENPENSGITRFQFRKNLDGRDGYEILLQAENFGTRTVQGDAVIKVDKYLIEKENLILNPGEKKTLIFQYEGLSAGSATAELLWDDDLSTDNAARDVFRTEQEIRTLFVSKGDTFLENALRAYPRMRVFVPTIPEAVTSEAASEYDLLIFDKIQPPPLKKGNILLIAPESFEGLGIPAIADGTIQAPLISWQAPDHPLTRGLDLNGIFIAGATNVPDYSDEIVPLIKCGTSPLSFVYTKAGLRLVYLGIDLPNSDFPLRASFPLFIGRTITFLNTGYLERPVFQISPGEAFMVRFPVEAEFYTIITPDGKKIDLPYAENGAEFLETEQAGFYRISGPDYSSAFAVNMTDPLESDIIPRSISIKDSGNNIERENSFENIKIPVWPIFVFLAILFLCAEWFIWVKKWE